jgi:hypothetical protein
MKGITVREALRIMEDNQIRYGGYRRNEQTVKAAKTLMGAYKSTNCVNNCMNLRTAISYFSKSPQKAYKSHEQNGLQEYQIASCGKDDYYVLYGSYTYINCDGNGIRECFYTTRDGFGGHFKSMQEAVNAAKKHKAKRELSSRSFTIERKTDARGRLFALVWESDIVTLLRNAGFSFIDHTNIVLNRPLCEVGCYTVTVNCYGTGIPIKIWVVPTAS